MGYFARLQEINFIKRYTVSRHHGVLCKATRNKLYKEIYRLSASWGVLEGFKKNKLHYGTAQILHQKLQDQNLIKGMYS